MPSTDSLNNLIKKRIIIAIFAIITTVTGAVLISIILPDKKDKKAPKLPGLTHYDSVSGVFSLDYPTFLEKIRESTDGFSANIGVELMADNIFEKVDGYVKGKDWMLIAILPISDISYSFAEQVISSADSMKDWITAIETVSTQKSKNFIYIEKRIRERIIGARFYDIVRIQTSDGFHVIAWASVKNKNWKNYKKEIRDSFKSIEFFPSVASELLEKLPDP